MKIQECKDEKFLIVEEFIGDFDKEQFYTVVGQLVDMEDNEVWELEKLVDVLVNNDKGIKLDYHTVLNNFKNNDYYQMLLTHYLLTSKDDFDRRYNNGK